MITQDRLRKKKCFLQADKLIIDSESYPIESLKEQRTGLLLFIIIITIGCLIYASRLCLIIFSILSPKITNLLLKNIIFFLIAFFFIGWFLVIVKFIYNIFKYRGIWTINHYHTLWIEKNDPPNLEASLKQIETTLPIVNFTKRIPINAIILLIIGMALGSSSIILVKINKILMPVSLICGLLLIFVAAIWLGIHSWNKTTWKK
jgi:hypothetical protein